MRTLLEVLVIQVVIAILGAMTIGTYYAMDQVSVSDLSLKGEA